MTLACYIVHSTSTDNEKETVSGRYDCPLSDFGNKQPYLTLMQRFCTKETRKIIECL